MNKRYILSTEPTEGLQAAVFATCAVSPMEALEDVERELSEFRGKSFSTYCSPTAIRQTGIS
jgi:hypothetical protein